MPAFTIKQLEALYWVGSLGSFEAASSYLNVAQSTISKRLAELEAQFAEPLFDRSSRASRLTARGAEVRSIAQDILRLNDRLAASARATEAAPMRFRLGMTDLVAMSWMSELLRQILDRYPEIRVDPEISVTSELLAGLGERRLDMAICPRAIQQPQFEHVPLGAIELAWMCAPDLCNDPAPLSREALLRLPLLTQSSGSILWPVLKSVVDNPRLPFKRRITCNNMAALAEMAAAGMGVTILPRAFFLRHVREGRLRILQSSIPLPQLEYFVNYRTGYHDGFFAEVTGMARGLCDFRMREQGELSAVADGPA